MSIRTNQELSETRHVAVEYSGLTGDRYGTIDDRPALVLLAGLSFSRAIWGPALRALAEVDPDRCVLTLDLPGHGDSPNQLPHSLDHVVDLVHTAIVEAGFDSPVLVGHSMAGGLVTVYAARYPTAGAINLDAAPDLGNFTRLLQTMADKITGPQFPQVWEYMRQSFRTELLPADMRALVAATSLPHQHLVVSYWADLLRAQPAQIDAWILADLKALAATRVPYLFIAGSEPTAGVRGLIARELPGASIEVWADGGHFPHLAYLDRFVARLQATGCWVTRS